MNCNFNVAKTISWGLAEIFGCHLAFAATPTGAANSQPSDTIIQQKTGNQNPFSFNYGPAQSPALNLLGLSPSKATLYNSPQPFVLAIPSLIDGSGNQAIALDLAPAWAAQKLSPAYAIKKDTYSNGSELLYAWYRSRLELAITDGATSTTAANIQTSGLAIGLATSPFRWSDPITARLPGEGNDYFDDCLSGQNGGPDVITYIINDMNNSVGQVGAGGTTGVATAAQLKALQNAKSNADVTSEITSCMQAAATVANASPDVSLGLGYVTAGKPGAFRDFHSGEASWIAGRIPVPIPYWTQLSSLKPSQLSGDTNQARYLMLGGSLTYQNQTRLVTGNSKIPLTSGNIFGSWLGLEAYGPSLRFGAEGGYTDTLAQENGDGKFSSRGFRWLVNGAYKVPFLSTVWLNISYGTAFGSTTKLDGRTVLVALQFSAPPAEALFPSAPDEAGQAEK